MAYKNQKKNKRHSDEIRKDRKAKKHLREKPKHTPMSLKMMESLISKL